MKPSSRCFIPLAVRADTDPKRKRGLQLSSSLTLRVGVDCLIRGRERFKTAGFSLVEVIAASAVLAACFLLATQMMNAVARQRRSTAQREVALAEAGNQMERLTLRPWDELTAEALAEVKLSELATEQLPGGELKLAVSTTAGEPAGKRLQLEIRYRMENGQFIAPVRLVSWIYRPSKGTP